MSTKALDQVGHAGAFHHIVRRKAAASDTGLNYLRDVQAKVLYLPLSGEGVFGKGLEGNLQKRKEQKEQLSDLVPDFAQARSDSGRKRKFVDNRNSWNNKRSRTDLSNKTAFQSKPKTAYSAYSRFNDDKKSSYGYKKVPKDTGHSFRIPLKQRK